MRKVAVARCAFVVLTLSTLAASGADQVVTIKEAEFEITFPEKWKVIKDAKTPVFFTAKSSDSSVEAGVDNQGSKNFKTLKDFVDFKFGDKKNEIVSNIETKVGERDALKVTREFAGFLVVENYCFVAGTCVYCIWFQMTKADSKKNAKDIDAIVKSFKLIEAK